MGMFSTISPKRGDFSISGAAQSTRREWKSGSGSQENRDNTGERTRVPERSASLSQRVAERRSEPCRAPHGSETANGYPQSGRLSQTEMAQLEEITQKSRQTAETFHRARELSKLRPQDKVWVTDKKKYGVVTKTAAEPRSYWLDVEGRKLRRNRRFLIEVHDVSKPEPSRPLQPDDPGIWDYILAL